MTRFSLIQSGIVDRIEASRLVHGWRLLGNRIVFTNGCFDILHLGHIYLLAEAASSGHKLVVGLNSDESVRRLKGKGRPVNSEQSRATLLAALSIVDAVVIFEEDTPAELIEALRPDVLVKGGDYSESQLAGADRIKSWGGEVKVVPLLEGYSTTAIEKEIRSGDRYLEIK